MCLYPNLIKNPKYIPNKKNGGHPPKAEDPRVLWVPIGCGKCIECRRQKANNWKIRLIEELKENKQCYFITLTFSEDSLNELYIKYHEKNEELSHKENEIATLATRYFLERWRKKYKKSVRHWLITELGHQGTERIHLHGLIWCNEEQIKDLEKIWSYGWVFIGNYVNNKTINYIIKYVTKIDNDHISFEGKILCSAGLGRNYIRKKINKETGEEIKIGEGYRFNAFNNENTTEYYRTKEGFKLNLPIYYRNHIYSEKEREKLWIQLMNKEERFINGVKYSFKTDEDKKKFLRNLITAQKDNVKNGFGSKTWEKNNYMKLIFKISKLK